jgi:hypothetical protein
MKFKPNFIKFSEKLLSLGTFSRSKSGWSMKLLPLTVTGVKFHYNRIHLAAVATAIIVYFLVVLFNNAFPTAYF